jgi:3-methyladenine DNA glycosylase/8-oxoguanine DNA glycosylase
MKLSLIARPPFNFRSVIHSHGWYQLAPNLWDDERQTLTRVERLASGRVALLSLTGTGHTIIAEAPGRFGKREQSEIAGKLGWMFMLDADFDEFYALAERETRLQHVRPKAMGRWLRSSTLFEDVVKVMMTTNIQWGGTKRLVASLVARYGEPLPANPSLRAFPMAEVIGRSRETTLRALGLGYRAPYLLQLARGIVSGRYNLDGLADEIRPTQEVRNDLLSLPGIGPYAAATLLGLLGRYDFIGVDTEAVSNVSKGFYGGEPVGPKEVEAVFGRWGPYKSLAYWFWDWEGQQQSPMEAYENRGKTSGAENKN